MIVVLFEGGFVNEKGWAEIPHEILKEYISDKSTKITVVLNVAQNKIIIPINHKENFNKKFEKIHKIQGIISLQYRIIEKNGSPFQYRFYFKRSRQLHRFLNQKFMGILEQKKVPKHLKFVFPEMGSLFPRRTLCNINQGTLSVFRNAPPKLINYVNKLNQLNKKIYYAIIKLESSLNSIGKYDLLITFNEDSIRQIKLDSNADINEFNFVNFYLSKKRYSEFLRPKGLIYLKIPKSSEVVLKNSREYFKFFLNEKLYENFLVEEGVFDTVEAVRNLRVSIGKMKGIHDYFLNIKFFLEFIKNLDLSKKKVIDEYTEDDVNYFLKIKQQLEKVNLKHLEYDNIKKREIFKVQCEAIFMNNFDILITKNPLLEIDYSLNLINTALDLEFQKGYDRYLEKCKEKFQNKELKPLSEEEKNTIKALLTELKLDNRQIIDSKLIKNALFYASIFKTYIKIIEERFSDRLESISEQTKESIIKTEYHFPKFDELMFNNLPLILGVQYSFFDKYPESKTNVVVLNCFEKFHKRYTRLQRSYLELINRFGEDLCYLYLVSEDIKYLKSFITQKLLEKNQSKEKLAVLDTISLLAGNYSKITFRWANARHKIIAAASLAMFLIAFNLEKDISLSSICNNERIRVDQPVLNREVLKLAEVAISPVHDFDFKSFAITSEESKLIFRQAIINISIKAHIRNILANKDSKIINDLIYQLTFRIEFFKNYDFFKEILKESLSELDLLREETFPTNIIKKIEKCYNIIIS